MGFLDKLKNKINEGLDSSNSKTVHKSVKILRNATGAPKVSLEKMQSSGGVSLVKSAGAANTALTAQGLNGIRGKAVLVLDHSGSMSYDYSSGDVQTLVEKALAFGLQFATDEKVTIIPFDSSVKSSVDADLTNYHDIVNQKIYNRNTMGSTNLTDAFKEVRKIAESTNELIYCMVVTDGDPNDKTSCTQVVCDLAGYPVFVKFLALRDVPYLQMLDDLDDSYRLLDNVDAKFYPSIGHITDEGFATDMADEWKSWIDLATAAGVLTQ